MNIVDSGRRASGINDIKYVICPPSLTGPPCVTPSLRLKALEFGPGMQQLSRRSILLSFATFIMGNSGSSAAAVACNGNAALCSRLYSDVVQIGTHDSAFVGYLPTQNQEVSVSGQLDAGIRFLQAQTHLNNGVLTLCHTTCLEENSGPLTDYLTTIKTWMDANEGQVVTLLLTNGDNEPVSMFGDAMSSTGLATYAYTPPSVLQMSQWPTLQTLINDGTRLVMFLGMSPMLCLSQYAGTNYYRLRCGHDSGSLYQQ